jgi:hypothetical protein
MPSETMDVAWRCAELVYVDGNDAGARTTIAGEFLALAKKDDRGCQARFRVIS